MAKMNSSDGTFTNTSPNWNKTGTEPPSSMKTDGFRAGYKPPAGFFNWFWTKVSKCITELQNKINSIVSFLSADDFSLYKTVDTCTTTSQVTALATNSTYKDGKYTLVLTVAEGAVTTFGLLTSETAHMTFWSGIPILHFPSSNKTFKYVSNTWVRVYADANFSGYAKTHKYNDTSCNSLSQAYEFYIQNRGQYDVVYYNSSGQLQTFSVDGQVGIVRIDTRLGRMTLSNSNDTWRADDTNETFVNNTKKTTHVYLGISVANANIARNSAVADQTEAGRMYISGTDFVEYVDLLSTKDAEVTSQTSPPNYRFIQIWHKYDGTVTQRFKIGNDTWSAWT